MRVRELIDLLQYQALDDEVVVVTDAGQAVADVTDVDTRDVLVERTDGLHEDVLVPAPAAALEVDHVNRRRLA